jgi:hypothetical protein
MGRFHKAWRYGRPDADLKYARRGSNPRPLASKAGHDRDTLQNAQHIFIDIRRRPSEILLDPWAFDRWWPLWGFGEPHVNAPGLPPPETAGALDTRAFSD